MSDASTLRSTTDHIPVITNLANGCFKTILKIPTSGYRFAEGGLRTRGRFKENKPDCPLISIVTIVFNGEAHLEDALRSVIDQTWTNVEYIVIDGGSKDRTVDILRKYDNLIDYWISEKDNGISDAFNKGISCATGQFIGIINADDWYEAGTLEAVANAIINDPDAGVVCGRIQYWKQCRKDFEFESNPSRLHLEMTVNHPSCFVRRDVYQRWGVFRNDFKCAMDYELLLRFKTKGVKFNSLDSVLANMRLDGTSDKYWKRSLTESRQAKLEHLGYPARTWMYWYFQYVRRNIRDILLSAGLNSLIRVYRKYFSVLAKHESY